MAVADAIVASFKAINCLKLLRMDRNIDMLTVDYVRMKNFESGTFRMRNSTENIILHHSLS
jgi:hypothetical protein